MSEANKDLVRRVISVGENGGLSELDQYFDPDFKVHDSIPGVPSTLDGVKIAHGMASTMFTKRQISISEIYADQDKVFVRLGGTCTTQGGVPFWPGDVNDGPKEFHFEGWTIYRVVDGKVTEAWGLIEVVLAMLQVRLQLLRGLAESLPGLVAPGSIEFR